MANKKVIVVATGSAEEPTIEAAAFRVESPDGTARDHTFGVGTYEVGSGRCDLTLTGDDEVAELHARLLISPGGVTITNADPRRPLFDATGRPVRTVHHLRVDEPIRIGNHILILRRPVPARSGSMPAPAATLPALKYPSLSPTSVASPIASRTATTNPEVPAARWGTAPAEPPRERRSAPARRQRDDNEDE